MTTPDLDAFAARWSASQIAHPDTAAAFIRDSVESVGGGFHPEDSFSEYVNLHTEVPTFTATQATRLDAARQQAYRVLTAAGIDPSQICLDMVKEQS